MNKVVSRSACSGSVPGIAAVQDGFGRVVAYDDVDPIFPGSEYRLTVRSVGLKTMVVIKLIRMKRVPVLGVLPVWVVGSVLAEAQLYDAEASLAISDPVIRTMLQKEFANYPYLFSLTT